MTTKEIIIAETASMNKFISDINGDLRVNAMFVTADNTVILTLNKRTETLETHTEKYYNTNNEGYAIMGRFMSKCITTLGSTYSKIINSTIDQNAQKIMNEYWPDGVPVASSEEGEKDIVERTKEAGAIDLESLAAKMRNAGIILEKKTDSKDIAYDRPLHSADVPSGNPSFPVFTHRGLSGTVAYDEEGELYVGVIDGIKSVVSFKGETIEHAEKNFLKAVDYYLANQPEATNGQDEPDPAAKVESDSAEAPAPNYGMRPASDNGYVKAEKKENDDTDVDDFFLDFKEDNSGKRDNAE